MSLTDCHGVAVFDFANMSGCTQLIKEPTNKLGNCLNLLLTVVPGVVDPLVDPPLNNSVHSPNSFSAKVKIPNISLPRKVYLTSCVDWPRVGDDLLNHNWIMVYNSPNPVSEFSKVSLP